MTINRELLDILACPKCKENIRLEGEDKLVCDICKKYYPIKEGIPVMMIDEAVDYVPTILLQDTMTR